MKDIERREPITATPQNARDKVRCLWFIRQYDLLKEHTAYVESLKRRKYSAKLAWNPGCFWWTIARRETTVSIEKFVEDQISKAIESGEFENLPGKGKPIDLRAYFETPEELRMAYAILKSNDFAPQEVEVLKEIDALRRKLDSCTDEEQKDKLRKEISDKKLAFDLLIEKPKNRR